MTLLSATQISRQYPIARQTIYRLLNEGRISVYNKLYDPHEVINAIRPKPNNRRSIIPNCEWRDIDGFPNYMVNVYGQVYQKIRTKRRMPGLLLEQTSANGYKQVQLIEGNCRIFVYVHRIVAVAFLKNPHGKNEVNHKDLDKTNNHYSNLEWVTRKENMRHYKINKKSVSKSNSKKPQLTCDK